MSIIRDEEMFGLAMIALLHQWGIKRCNVKDCNQEPTTIVTGVSDCPLGLCEIHYNEFKETGKISVDA
jgi:hypothetical protein